MKNNFANFFDLFKNLGKKITSVLNLVVAILFYFLGIGLTKIVAFLFGKNFIEETFKISSWHKSVKKINLEKKF